MIYYKIKKMEYELNYISDKKIVFVKTEGRLNFQKASHYSVEATKLAFLNNCNKYIIDHSETNLEHGIYKLHTDGAAMEHFGFKSSDHVAIIIASDTDRHYLTEKDTQAAKWCHVRYFANITEAEEWLAKA